MLLHIKLLSSFGSNVSVAGLTTFSDRVKFTNYHEVVDALSISANVTTVDLDNANTFTLSATDDVNHFTLTNIPSGSTSFSILITQDSTGGHTIDIDDFKTTGGVAIPVYWPGGVVPTPTTTASRSDVYSFKTFDGGSTLYGVVTGQNFQN